jgi:hypothetical protein
MRKGFSFEGLMNEKYAVAMSYANNLTKAALGICPDLTHSFPDEMIAFSMSSILILRGRRLGWPVPSTACLTTSLSSPNISAKSSSLGYDGYSLSVVSDSVGWVAGSDCCNSRGLYEKIGEVTFGVGGLMAMFLASDSCGSRGLNGDDLVGMSIVGITRRGGMALV